MEDRTQKKVIALGFFDGVHMGHGALLRRTVELAKALDAVPAAHTFAQHPSTLLSGSPVPLLSTPEDRAELMKGLYGIREVIAAPFDKEMMTMPWETFVLDHLIRRWNCVGVVVGHDYRFGYKGEGDPQKLKELCAAHSIACEVVEKVTLDGRVVSSTYIRSLVEAGDMEAACRYLAHPHLLSGEVRHGKGLGKTLGFPTVNISPAPGILIPAYGVYASKVTTQDGKTYAAATNIGVRPTVADGGQVTVEGFLLDFHGDVYGQRVKLELYHRLRGERRFNGLEELRREVLKNAQETREYFQCETTPGKD